MLVEEAPMFKLIVCDLAMRTQDGLLVAEQVVKSYKDAHLPVPFICWCSAMKRKKFLSNGQTRSVSNFFVVKPFEVQEFFQMIQLCEM